MAVDWTVHFCSIPGRWENVGFFISPCRETLRLADGLKRETLRFADGLKSCWFSNAGAKEVCKWIKF